MESFRLPSATYRILDAAFNRAAEGFRVVEDFLRLSLSDRYLARTTKDLRHQLTVASTQLDAHARIAARDTLNDVGCDIQADSEFVRYSNEDVVRANLARVQQSLRTLEEYGKTISVKFSQSVEKLRYQTYTLEKAILTTLSSRQNLEQAQLYVLIDARFESGDFEPLVEQLIEAKVDLIQLREKRLNDREQVKVGLQLTALTRDTPTRWIMNDRADLAVAAGADGVHVGQDDLSVAAARQIVGAERMVGVSTHSLEQAQQAVLQGANYIGVGPVFASRTKQFDAHMGLELVREVADEIQLPAFAIGGVNQNNIEQIMRAGLCRAAVQQGIVGAEQPFQAAARFKSLISSSRSGE